MTTRIHPTDPPPPEHDDEQLPCGRLLSQVWSAWEDNALDDHQLHCLHCQKAIDGLETVETAVRQLQESPDETSGFDAGQLTQRVMDVVRQELRPGRPLPLGGPAEDTWIMESVAARALRTAAEQVPGVRAGSCRIAPDDPAGGSQVTVRLSIHAPLSTPNLRELAEQVRQAVEHASDQRLGLDISVVDVRVTDLVDTPARTERDREK